MPAKLERSLRASAGHTLVELVVVIGIISIIMGAMMLRLSTSYIDATRGEYVAQRLAGDLRYAQSEAIATANNYYISFTDDGSKLTDYTIYRVEAGADVQVEPTRTIQSGVALTSADTRAEFAPGGDALGNYTYTVTSPGTSRQIDVTLSTGAVQITEVP